MRKLLACFALIAALLTTAGCGGPDPGPAETWPASGLGAVLPAPETGDISIGYEISDVFLAYIENASHEDFLAYLEQCSASGFTVDPQQSTDDYDAYREDGYRVTLSYSDYSEEVTITLFTPKVNSTFSWPTMGLAALLPTPATDVGTIDMDTSSQFTAYIGEADYDDYTSYVDQCIANGFTLDHSRSDDLYTADNEEGVSLRVQSRPRVKRVA